MNWKLNRYEKSIENALLRGEYKPADPKTVELIARSIERFKKNAVLNIRINQQDLDALKAKAKHLNVPYQTLISELLHHYAEQ